MKEISFYDHAGIVVPGAILMLGLLYLFPELRPLFGKNAISVGGLGIFLLVAYAVGHLVASAGNLFEWLFWLPVGGNPSSWVVHSNLRILERHQLEALRTKLKSRLGIEVAELAATPRREWMGHFGQAYRDALAGPSSARIETFNGLYGLSRGLASACVLFALLDLGTRCDWREVAAAILAASVFGYRMFRFSIYFAREVLIRFTLLPDPRP
jgi:hypothetical protein